jgi:NtrC-family two-component system sensor histidine kinase KinB
MIRRYLDFAYWLAGVVVLVMLIWLTLAAPPAPNQLLPGILFGALIVFTDVFGVHLAGGLVSLLPMTTVAAYLVMGPVLTGWAAFVGSMIQAELRFRWADWLRLPRLSGRSELITVGTANGVAHTASVLLGGAIFQMLGGKVPLTVVESYDVVPLVTFAVAYLAINHLFFLPIIAARGLSALRRHIRSLPTLVLCEGGPLVLAPLMALIYTRLGIVHFVLFALGVTAASLITRSLAQTSRRVERRVQELSSLQAVGRALSASLDVEAVVSAIYDQVARLMPARNFYVALYAPDVEEVSFPLAVEEGRFVTWRSRQAGSGLTEYVLQTGEPLLMRGDVEVTLEKLGIASIGRTAECWLGVPILAADDALGVIAVQSYETPEAYDFSHQAVLSTIASQAAVAIQNARLYARTDKALARRVHELDSILRTTQEGILLLDTDWGIVAANRALAGFLGVAQLELSGHLLDPPRPDRDEPLIALLAYSPEDLRADCQALVEGEETAKQKVVTLAAAGRHVERTLTPVRGGNGLITGWLLVLRDVTEEIELNRLKDDLTHMLVHDLRSPLTVLSNSLTLMGEAFTEGDPQLFDAVTRIAKQTGERMLTLINALLDISELESDQLELACEAVDVRSLLQESIAQFSSLAASAQVTLETSIARDLPALYVDLSLVARVLSNLLDNAVRFSPSGGRVRLWARSGGRSAPDHLLIGVSDEGPGIPREERDRVFEKFYRGSSVRASRSGSGLGLAFCKLAVEAHGGNIWVESPSNDVDTAKMGPGSTFVLTLPVASDSLPA